MDENEVIDTLDGFDDALTALETPADDSDDRTVVPEVDEEANDPAEGGPADESDPAADAANTDVTDPAVGSPKANKAFAEQRIQNNQRRDKDNALPHSLDRTPRVRYRACRPAHTARIPAQVPAWAIYRYPSCGHPTQLLAVCAVDAKPASLVRAKATGPRQPRPARAAFSRQGRSCRRSRAIGVKRSGSGMKCSRDRAATALRAQSVAEAPGHAALPLRLA